MSAPCDLRHPFADIQSADCVENRTQLSKFADFKCSRVAELYLLDCIDSQIILGWKFRMEEYQKVSVIYN